MSRMSVQNDPFPWSKLDLYDLRSKMVFSVGMAFRMSCLCFLSCEEACRTSIDSHSF